MRMGITGVPMNPCDSRGMETILRDFRGNVAVHDFYGASAPTSKSATHFFHMQNLGACLTTMITHGTSALVNVGNFL